MEQLGKPSGITLKEHTDNVLSEGKKLVENYPFVVEKYAVMTQADFAKRLEGACKYHDDGKGNSPWQEACQKDYLAFLDWQKKNGGSFENYSKFMNGNSAPCLSKGEMRHEILSVIRFLNKLPQPVLVAIGAHHGKLAKKHESKWTENEIFKGKGKDAWNSFCRLNNEYSSKPLSTFRTVLKQHYEFAGLRGYLQLADHRASATEIGDWIPDYVPFEYNFPQSWDRRSVQKIAEENWQDDLLLIRAPTGAGKTAASLLWAKKQIDNKRADRLVIAMPTRFTSNALAVNVESSLSDTGLYHSSAWFQKFHEKTKNNRTEFNKASKTHEFAKLLQVPATVCTIDHLLMALTLSREEHHGIVFNLAHSCVVIDEADFYDDFTQANILVLLEALNELKVPVMIMSASLPESSLKMYQTTGYSVTEIKEDTSDNTRLRCKVCSKTNYESLAEIEDLLIKCTEQPSIIYANTVAKAVAIYDWFNEKTGVKPILYHSRFTEPDKLEKEKLLLDSFGREAWENGTANGIAILTQIGEMSINISADFMISEFCPIDRLVQRAGRLCRFDKGKIGNLHILIPMQNKKEEKFIYPAPYGTLEKRVWKACPAFEKTLELLELKSYSAQDFVDFINIVYSDIEDFSARAKSNAKMLKENFVYNWVILPMSTPELDDTETQFWKSRDIDNNITVLTKFPENQYFKNYLDWQSYQNECSISLPVYLMQQGIKLHKIYKAEIRFKEDEKLEFWCCYEGVYNDEKGFFFETNLGEIFL